MTISSFGALLNAAVTDYFLLKMDGSTMRIMAAGGEDMQSLSCGIAETPSDLQSRFIA